MDTDAVLSKSGEGKSDNFIRLIVITTGEDLDEEFNIHEPMLVVKQRALQKVQPGADKDLFTLQYNNQPLDDSKRIQDYIDQYGWTDESDYHG